MNTMSAMNQDRQPLVLETPQMARAWSREVRRSGRTLALVPTMGALHAGHRFLLQEARSSADVVVASIFVNPAQFGAGEDFAQYPRPLEADLDACAAEGADAVYVPAAGSLYAGDHSTWVVEDSLADVLEGRRRPGHFRGVLTVVLKLFSAVEPDVAVFGQKDAQQALLIRRMVRDLDLAVAIHVAATVRDSDGLALSSRNAYLDAQHRRQAPVLWQALCACRKALEEGEDDPARVRAAGLGVLDAAAGLDLDYLEAVDLDTLSTPLRQGRPVLVAGAIRLGKTRLIDNIIYPPDALRAPTDGVSAS